MHNSHGLFSVIIILGSFFSGITNSQGVASVTVSNINSETTFTASYSNVSDTCTVTVSNVLFSDTCATDNTSNYTVQGNCTITYNNSGYYVIKKGSGTGTAGVKVNNVTLPKNVKITADIRLNTTSNTQAQFIILKGASSTGYGGRLLSYSGGELGIITGTLTSSISGLKATSLSLSTSTWYTMEFIVQNTSLTLNLYVNGSLSKTVSTTGNIQLEDSNSFGFAVANDNNNNYNIKNIVVEAL